MGKALWESHGNVNWLQNWEWEWEGMGIDCTGMGGSGNVKKPFPGISAAYYYLAPQYCTTYYLAVIGLHERTPICRRREQVLLSAQKMVG